MDQNRDSGDETESRAEGTITGPLGQGPPMQPWSPSSQAQQQAPSQPAQYIPPELRPQGTSYTGSEIPAQQSGQPTTQVYREQTVAEQRRPHRGSILGPIFLIAAGMLFFLNTLEIVDWNVWGSLWRLWPLVLIAIGIDLLVGRRSRGLSIALALGVLALGAAFLYSRGEFQAPGNVLSRDIAVPLNGVSSADVEIDLDAGELTVDGNVRDSASLATGTLEYYENRGLPEPEVEVEDGAAQLRLGQRGGPSWVGFGSGNGRSLTWNVSLNPSVPMNLKVDTGAGVANVNMERMQVKEFRLDSGAGERTIVFPTSAGMTTAEVDGGAGEIDIIIPQSVEARIEVNSGVGHVEVDGRFTKSGDTYVSPGYANATNKLSLNIDQGVGEIRIRSGTVVP